MNKELNCKEQGYSGDARLKRKDLDTIWFCKVNGDVQ